MKDNELFINDQQNVTNMSVSHVASYVADVESL